MINKKEVIMPSRLLEQIQNKMAFDPNFNRERLVDRRAQAVQVPPQQGFDMSYNSGISDAPTEVFGTKQFNPYRKIVHQEEEPGWINKMVDNLLYGRESDRIRPIKRGMTKDEIDDYTLANQGEKLRALREQIWDMQEQNKFKGGITGKEQYEKYNNLLKSLAYYEQQTKDLAGGDTVHMSPPYDAPTPYGAQLLNRTAREVDAYNPTVSSMYGYGDSTLGGTEEALLDVAKMPWNVATPYSVSGIGGDIRDLYAHTKQGNPWNVLAKLGNLVARGVGHNLYKNRVPDDKKVAVNSGANTFGTFADAMLPLADTQGRDNYANPNYKHRLTNQPNYRQMQPKWQEFYENNFNR